MLHIVPFRAIRGSSLRQSSRILLSLPATKHIQIQPSIADILHFHTKVSSLKMADDASYNTFLSKANQDPNSGPDSTTQSTSQARSKYDPTSSSSGGDSSALPASLKNLPNVQYVSDTDSDFEPVFFSYASHVLPDVKEFEHILSKTGKGISSVEKLSVKDFDPRDEYAEIVEKVKEAGNGEGVVVFRAEVDKTRVEYYILTVGERKLVGVVAKAVES